MERIDKEFRELFSLLEERLVQHDNNRKEVQCHLQDAHSKILEEVDSLEEKLNNEIRKEFEKREEHVLSLNNKLNTEDNNDNNDEINKDAFIKRELQKELSSRRRYEIEHVKGAKCFSDSYRLKLICDEIEAEEEDYEPNATTDKLEGYLNRICDSMIASQNRVAQICSERRTEAEKLERKINEKLEPLFIQEDARIQSTVTYIRERIENGCTASEKKDLIRKARMTLAVRQNYSFDDSSIENSLDACDLVVTKRIFPQYFDLEERKPTNFKATFTEKGILSVSFALFSNDDEDTLKPLNLPFTVIASLWKKDRNEGATARTLTKEYAFSDNKTICFSDTFTPRTTYCLKVRAEFQGLSTPWSDRVEFTTPEFKKCCRWRECPSYVNYGMKYSIDENNPRIATKNSWDNRYSTIIANMTIPLNAVTSWSIKVLESESNDANELFIGVSPSDIDQNEIDNSEKCGWYYDCYDSTLWSGPPHSYSWKKYGPKKGNDGKYVRKGDSVGVVMDTTKGDLSFVLNNVNYSVAYEGIPLDKPLVPCVLLFYKDDSIELDLSEVKENAVDSSVPIPSKITAKKTTWDSITLTWDEAENASFFQVEVDGSRLWDVSAANSFTKRGLFPETEHVFRLRTVRGSLVSEWSDAVKGRTLKAPEFSECAWKECPDYVVDEETKYAVDEKNPKIATKIDGHDSHCTIIGNTHIPPNSVTSWSIKILKEKWDDGYGIFVGAAPSDIDQNIDDNSYRCGWYLHCYDSTLWSGPPHNYYKGKKYVFKKPVGQYVHAGESVDVVMDTIKRELSFVLNDVNLGVAFEGIPLDKPLVPCVLLENGGDFVELVLSAIKGIKIDTSIPIPSNIVAKGLLWDSITLTWDKVVNAPLYQIEMNGSKYWDTTMINSFTKSGLLSEAEYSFRVRTVRGSSVSEWSDAVKGRTLKAPEFSECAWKECPADVDEGTKYAVDEKNPRIATKINDNDYCTVINNSPFPLDTVTSWSIKVLKSEDGDGNSILIGVAQNDINQNDFNCGKCGWYFDCYSSSLCSGPPHNYWTKEYGPRKEKDGQYVHDGDSVGVVMDTMKGELSFVLNGVNYGVAFEGIPLDKPLVPCVLLFWKDDSIELLT